jgi:hypothetical protein
VTWTERVRVPRVEVLPCNEGLLFRINQINLGES